MRQMKNERLVTLLMLALCQLLTPAAFGLDLEHTQARFTFNTTGKDVVLLSAVDKTVSPNGTVAMAAESGRWTVTLGYQTGNPSAPLETFSFDVDGVACGGGDCATVTRDYILVGTTSLKASWSAVVTFQGVTRTLQIITNWELVPGEPRIESWIRTKWTGSTAPPYYVSSTTFPELRVARFDRPQAGDHDWLVAPYNAGALIRRPTSDGFPDWWGQRPFFTFHASAYYEDATGTGVLLHSDDGDDEYKFLELSVEPDVGETAGVVEMRLRNIPRNIYDSLSYKTQHRQLVTLFQGDWTTAAAAHRTMLRSDVAWFPPPVGSPNHTMSQDGKELVGEFLVGQGLSDDGMDVIARGVDELARVIGHGLMTVWYGAHWPEEFDHFYTQDGVGYLPGRPSLAAAMREAQEDFGSLAAPYVQSTLGEDWEDISPPITPNTFQLDVHDAFTRTEKQEIADFCAAVTGCPPRSGWMDPGTEFFEDLLPRTILTIGHFTGMKAVYLDYYLTQADYWLSRDPADHRPGGGDYMYTGRMEQLRLVHDGLPGLTGLPDMFFAMEGAFGRYVERMHLMHLDVEGFPVTDEKVGTPGAELLPNAVTVPYFRMVFDNVKIGRISNLTGETEVGRRSWLIGTDVLTYGQLISGLYQIQDLVAPLSFQPHREHYAYLSSLAGLLRDEGFQTWHNGTLEALPGLIANTPWPTNADPGVDANCPPASMPCDETPVYVGSHLFAATWDGVLNAGMYRAPDDLGTADADTLALAVGNPWVGPDGGSVTFGCTFDPLEYDGWGSAPYSVELHSGGSVTVLATGQTGTYAIGHTLAAGELAYWVFRQ